MFLPTIYYIIIYPIELLLEICFTLINRMTGNPGIAIIGVSIVINFLLLPLYLRADKIQEGERKRQGKIQSWSDHIRKNFKGDEKVMLLSAYYRKMDYHPLYSLKSSISLILQIPFFVAAYHFLSNLNLLNGACFLYIQDLGRPDGLLKAGALTINILPVLMTLINCIAAVIYTWGTPLKENIQIYVLAGVFLILLYTSPSGLVLYWTMNNVFSLVKNLVLKGRTFKLEEKASDKAPGLAEYLLGGITLTCLIGLTIPSALVASSPTEFVEMLAYKNPLTYVASTFCVSAGFFLCWLSVFYALASNKAKHRICLIIWVLCGITFVDYFLFVRDTGILSSELRYNEFPVFTVNQILLQLGVLAVTVAAIMLIRVKKTAAIRGIYTAFIACLVILTGFNIVRTIRIVSRTDFNLYDVDVEPSFNLSTKGKNVIVIMLDKAISGYVPYVMAEKPELKQQYSGFTYYPNTVSFGMHTNFTSASLYGGYEYSPVAMNARTDMTLGEKQDEAISVLPVLFANEGYESTVIDPPYAGYTTWPDLSIYDKYPEIKAYHARGHFSVREYYATVEASRRRSFFMYSLVRVSPMILQPYIYDNAEYLRAEKPGEVNWDILTCWGVLKNMAAMTRIKDSDGNTFMILDNEMTHQQTEFQLPDYDLVAHVNNEGLEKGYRIDDEGNRLEINERRDYIEYHTNAAALIMLGEWFDYLKQNGVYDNTRIVIVADHGDKLGNFPKLILDNGTDMEQANPLLMFKDFGDGEFKEAHDFMTNADTPVLALKDLVDDPVNPFTGGKLDGHEKNQGVQYVTLSHNWSTIDEPNTADKIRFTTDDEPWYSIHDNIFEKSYWVEVPEPGTE